MQPDRSEHPAAATTEPRERLSIERRIAMRRNIEFARGVPKNKMVAVPADELEALLDAYEHGGFRTNG